MAAVLLPATLGERAQAGMRHRTGWLVLALLLAAWAWMPGAWGLTYWLRLAFQTPSLTAALLALTVVARYVGRDRAWYEGRYLGLPGGAPLAMSALYWSAGVALGWVLVLDTFAVLPISVYAWGFQPSAYALVCGLSLLPWVLTGAAAWRVGGMWQLCAALALFGLWRWPTGNVWDAVLDPWLWLVLHGYALRALARRWRVRASGASPAATPGPGATAADTTGWPV